MSLIHVQFVGEYFPVKAIVFFLLWYKYKLVWPAQVIKRGLVLTMLMIVLFLQTLSSLGFPALETYCNAEHLDAVTVCCAFYKYQL